MSTKLPMQQQYTAAPPEHTEKTHCQEKKHTRTTVGLQEHIEEEELVATELMIVNAEVGLVQMLQ